MIDKLILLSPMVKKHVEALALKHGTPAAGYQRCIDLRETKLKLPVRLFYCGNYNRINKIELVHVARLGLPLTQKILESILSDAKRARIYRIDLCVDVLGLPPWFFVTNARIARQQNYALYRSPGAVSYYLEFSKQRKVVFYDRLRLLRKQKDPLANIFRPDDQLTRIEIQLMGAAVPYRRFTDIHRYANGSALMHLHFRKLRVAAGSHTPVKRLVAYGLRWLISKYGQQATSRMFSSPEWAALKRAYLEPLEQTEIPAIEWLMRKSTRRWLKGQLYFPRAKH